jgi:glycosyltransferase involved in cell wall biosynthesis
VKYTVVMPLYNKSAHVEETLQAVLAQTRPPDELIVVDDASSDDSLARVRNALDRQSTLKVTLLPLPKNAGPGNARNQGMAFAGGDYVHFLDADDRLYHGCLERVIDVLEKHRPDFLILGYRRSGDGVLRPTLADLRPQMALLSDGLYHLPNPLAAMANDGMGIIGSNLVCRRDRLSGLDYDTRANHFEGVDFWYRSFSCAENLKVLLLIDTCMEYLELPDGLLSRKAVRADEITVPTLLRRLVVATDPEAHLMRRRLARSWLNNAFERLPNRRQKLLFLWHRRIWIWRYWRWTRGGARR